MIHSTYLLDNFTGSEQVARLTQGFHNSTKMYGYNRMPSRVSAIKWLGVLQLIHGILIFIVTIVLFAVDFEENKANTFMFHILLGLVLTILAIGAGVAGSSMSRYEGLMHNLSTKNVCMALSVMNAFMAIFYMVIGGTNMFYQVDKVVTLSETADWYKTSFGMVVITFILAFFNMIVAFMTVILCALWMPREYQDQPSPYPSERRIIEEPYVVREERAPYSRYNRYGYPQDPYYSPGYRTLPALKY